MVSIEKIHSMTRAELNEALGEVNTGMRQLITVVEQIMREGLSEKNLPTFMRTQTLFNKLSAIYALLVERAYALGDVPEEIYAEKIRGIIDHMV